VLVPSPYPKSSQFHSQYFIEGLVPTKIQFITTGRMQLKKLLKCLYYRRYYIYQDLAYEKDKIKPKHHFYIFSSSKCLV